ncbi:RNA polymerase sigma factor [uncultured Bacteroides sp.]|uniref:RNA polymerase sigma factor n=1 Tax=uncultured Bacteroides sp. TaxID=162156 RepID=UPI0025D31AEC|nr:sigma-70 family RNA polymerase sigma factor [uncultured Bacteroides sp.]
MQVLDESHTKWKLFLKGDSKAYSWLYTNYIQLLYKYGLQITPDKEIIKDCIQDVFVRIYKNREKLCIPRNVKVYLMISLKNSIYNVFSKERSEEAYAFSFHLVEEQYIVENSFFSEEERREKMKEIKRIFRVLTPRQREIIYYRFIEEMEYDEICQIMNLNYQSAYNLLQRSLQKVRDTFGTSECLVWISILATFFKETQKIHFS